MLGGHLCRCTGYVKILRGRAGGGAAQGGRASDVSAGGATARAGVGLRRAAQAQGGSARCCAATGRYLADLKLHGMLARRGRFAARTPHARISSIDTSAALADPRVAAVLDGRRPSRPAAAAVHRCRGDDEALQPADHRLATRSATSASRSRSSSPTTATSPRTSRDSGRRRLRAARRRSRRRSWRWRRARRSSTRRRTSASAHLPVRRRRTPPSRRRAARARANASRTQRYAGMPMESPRRDRRLGPPQRGGHPAVLDPGPEQRQARLCAFLELPESASAFSSRTSAAAFGVKLQTYPEEILLCFLARRLERPGKWVEDRWEHIVAATHGREQVHEVEVALRRRRPRARDPRPLVTNTGAYLQRLTLVEPFIGVAMLTGPTTSPTSRRPPTW